MARPISVIELDDQEKCELERRLNHLQPQNKTICEPISFCLEQKEQSRPMLPVPFPLALLALTSGPKDLSAME
jgi:hypothetical protein